MDNAAASSPPRPRVLLCGIGPVPLGAPEPIYAPGLRVWSFARALLEHGSPVDLLEVKFGETIQGGRAELHRLELDPEATGEAAFGGSDPAVRAQSRSLDEAPPAELVRRQAEREDYGLIVSTTDVINHACAQAAGEIPLWCDWFGHPMTERQSMARLYGSDGGLRDQWNYVLGPLLRADRFSGCGQHQAHAILGELGAVGRLNRHNDGCELAHACPPAALFPRYQKRDTAFRGRQVPPDAFAVLWAGGYNTWADPDTLARGLEIAMLEEPRIHFVSAGGAIKGHDQRTYQRFHDRMLASPVAESCHFAGWLDMEKVPDYYLEADLAINCGLGIYEGELGTRTRILDWICAGLNVATSDECEFTRQLAERQLAEVFPCGDADALARLLVDAARRPPESAAEKARRARDYLLDRHRPARLFQPLCDWAARPRRAPDALADTIRLPGLPFPVPDNPLARLRAEEWLGAWRPPAPQPRLRRLLRKVRRRLTHTPQGNPNQ